MTNRKEYTEEALREIIQATVAETLASTGQGNTEISQSQAKRLFGRWFIEAVAAGRIKPINSGKGGTSTKWYSILEIRSLRAAENFKAELQSRTL